MTTLETATKRVIELMIDNGLDTHNKLLVIQVTLIYLKAQRDILQEQRPLKGNSVRAQASL